MIATGARCATTNGIHSDVGPVFRCVIGASTMRRQGVLYRPPGMLALFGFFFLFLFPVTLVFASFLHGSPLARFQIPLVVYLVLGLVVGGLLLRRAMRQSDPYGFVH